MKAIWTQEEAEFHGEYVDFDPIWSWPKPVQKPHPPVIVGGLGEKVLDRVLDYGDEWMPNRAEPGRARAAHRRAARARRPPRPGHATTAPARGRVRRRARRRRRRPRAAAAPSGRRRRGAAAGGAVCRARRPPPLRQRLAQARVGRLATVTADGRPHVVPVCFALAGGRIYTAVDAKPKSTRALQRLDNVRATGRASLLVDHYEEDWSQLWWVRVDGPAEVIDSSAALDAPRRQVRAVPGRAARRPGDRDHAGALALLDTLRRREHALPSQSRRHGRPDGARAGHAAVPQPQAALVQGPARRAASATARSTG